MNLANLTSRSQIIRLIRRWFDERGFTEMHTPRLVGTPGQEPHLEPFWTKVTTPQLVARSSQLGQNRATSYELPAALITSPEYMMKRILAEGLDKIYDLGPCFRNKEPWDGTHDPEFLMLEWYRRDSELAYLMNDTEEMMTWVAKEFGKPMEKPFHRLTVEDAWKQYANIELAPLLDDRDAMSRLCREHGQTVTDGDSWDDLYFKIFLTEIEPKLGLERPTFLHRYPKSMAALARLSVDDPRFADRAELYVENLELANGFAELSDEQEQRRRFEEERTLRHKLGKKTWSLDEKFLVALPKMGDAAGIAFGVERFVMLLTGSTSINDILPTSARERFTGQS